MVSQRMGNGHFAHSTTCSFCNGRGRLPEVACPSCGGTGEKMKEEKIEFTIPAGVDSHHVLRIPGMGRHGGDMRIFIMIRNHPRFERIANDLYCSVSIPFLLALRGGKMQTTGLLGESIELDVPRACPYGSQVVADGKGIKGGNLVARIHYQLPFLNEDALDKVSNLIPPS